MNHSPQDKQFLASLAKSETGKELIRVLKNIETYYADIRNIGTTKPDVRIDALNMFREALLDKLLVMSGMVEPPNNDEYH